MDILQDLIIESPGLSTVGILVYRWHTIHILEILEASPMYRHSKNICPRPHIAEYGPGPLKGLLSNKSLPYDMNYFEKTVNLELKHTGYSESVAYSTHCV